MINSAHLNLISLGSKGNITDLGMASPATSAVLEGIIFSGWLLAETTLKVKDGYLSKCKEEEFDVS